MKVLSPLNHLKIRVRDRVSFEQVSLGISYVCIAVFPEFEPQINVHSLLHDNKGNTSQAQALTH